MKSYLHYQTLSQAERRDIQIDWDIYYQAILTTETYKNYQLQRKALADGRVVEVIGRAQYAHSLRETDSLLPLPSFPFDPAIFFAIFEIANYQTVLRKIEEAKRASGSVDF